MNQTTAPDGLRDVDFPPQDARLREDVGSLGSLVGEVLEDQLGAGFLAEVERVRRAAILRREGGAPADELLAELRRVPAGHHEELVRAFATYFQVVNIAERVHRIRRRREYQRAGAGAQPGGLLDALLRLRAAGVPLADVMGAINQLRIEPVFTAHPTEAVRRTLLEKEQTLVRALVDDIDRAQTPAERRADREVMRTTLTAGWQTAEAAPARPTVADEAGHVAYYLTDVLYRVVPAFYETLEDACRTAYDATPALPTVVRFGTWVGGDMDGNPNVTAATITATLQMQRGLILQKYRADVAALARLLSQDLARVGVTDDLLQRVSAYRQRFPGAAAAFGSRHQDMPYREFFHFVAARLDATAADGPDGYADPAAFAADLRAVAASLEENRGHNAGTFSLRRLQRRLATFGFHLATLDLRQDSAVHDAAIGSLLGDAGYAQLTVAEKLARLRRLGETGAVPAGDATAAATLAVFATVAAERQRLGEAAIGPYIISMARSAADVAGVLVLARLAGLAGTDGTVPLDVAPLFETVDDLERAPAVLAELCADPGYRRHLRARGNVQWVMLGYSDSAKDGGLVASRWALQEAQRQLVDTAQAAGITLHFFHGRGGSLSRGGSATGRAVFAAPPGSVHGVLRVTEQGEVIHRKYGIRALALRNLEQAAAAVLQTGAGQGPATPEQPGWRDITAGLAASSRQAFRALVYDDPEFPAYFRAATPIDVIERLYIGSRPARRATSGDVGSLRAIPWVFAWSQNRAGLTGWYGAGTALEAALAAGGSEALATMARDWPFFATLLDDLEMILAKSDMGIFECYSRLAGPLHGKFFPGIRAEFERTTACILRIKGARNLLDGDRRLQRSIRLRNPYVDPISLLQVDLLAQWRGSGRPAGPLFHSLVVTVNGIAAGVQNTG